jgi:Zn-dependent metalloprotease
MKKTLLFLFIMLAVLTATSWAQEGFSVELKDGKVAVEVKEASLRQVVYAIALKTEFEVAIDQGVEDRIVTAKFTLPVEEALKHLLKEESYTVDYKAERQLAKVTIYPKDMAQRKGLLEPPSQEPPKNANAEALKIVAELKKRDPSLRVFWDEKTGVPSFMFGKLADASAGKPGEIAQAFLTQYGKLLGIEDAGKQLKLDETFSELKGDKYGKYHAIYKQEHEGISVYNCTVGVHLAKDGAVEAVDGNFLGNLRAASDAKADMATEAAAKTLRGDIQDQKWKDPASDEEKILSMVTTPQLEWYPEKDNNVRLVWHSDVTNLDKHEAYRVFIDADSGQVIAKQQLHNEANIWTPGEVVTYLNTVALLNVPSLAGYRYTVCWGQNYYADPVVPFLYGSGNYMATARRSGGGYYWPYDSNANGKLEWAEGVGMAATVHYNAWRAWMYYRNFFGQNSWNNLGGSTWNWVTPGLANAYSLGNGYFEFGEAAFGSYRQGILGTLGVTAHEFGHGICSAAPTNLVYSGESAAVHEGSADIQACSCKYYYGENSPWNLIPVRNLAQTVTYSQYLAYQESHYGGQVLGNAAYRMSQVIGTPPIGYCHLYAIRYYFRGSVDLRSAYWKILYAVNAIYGYSWYVNCYNASWYPMYN